MERLFRKILFLVLQLNKTIKELHNSSLIVLNLSPFFLILHFYSLLSSRQISFKNIFSYTLQL